MKLEIISYLKACSGNEFIEIMSLVLPARPEIEDRNGLIERLVFCQASRLEDKSSPAYEGWSFNPVGDLDLSVYERDTTGEPFLQSGQCENCDVEVDSHVKRAICPLCGGSVECT